MKYYLYVDESGGISPENGPQKFLVIGAILVSEENLQKLEAAKTGILKNLNVGRKIPRLHLHSTEIRKHEEKVFYSKWLNTLPISAFALISNRETLSSDNIADMNVQNEYGNNVKTSTQHYNRNLRLLLEMVGAFTSEQNIRSDLLEVVIEESSNSINLLRSYIQRVQKNPKDNKVARVCNIRVSNIVSAKKGSCAGLDFADHVSHALFRAFHKEPQNMNIIEPRYFNEMKSRFYLKDHAILDSLKPNVDGTINIYMKTKMPLDKEHWEFINSIEPQKAK